MLDYTIDVDERINSEYFIIKLAKKVKKSFSIADRSQEALI
jgi:hypothetical protein